MYFCLITIYNTLSVSVLSTKMGLMHWSNMVEWLNESNLNMWWNWLPVFMFKVPSSLWKTISLKSPIKLNTSLSTVSMEISNTPKSTLGKFNKTVCFLHEHYNILSDIWQSIISDLVLCFLQNTEVLASFEKSQSTMKSYVNKLSEELYKESLW